MRSPSTESLTKRAAALERSGDWESAAAVYSDVFRCSAAAGDLTGIVEALRGSAHVRRCQGRYDDAEDLSVLRREIANLNNLPAEAARATHMLGVIRFIQDDFQGASQCYEIALTGLRDAGDDWQLGVTCQNLGVIAHIRGNLREARVLYLESISAAVRAGNPANAMQAYNNLAIICADMRDWMEAEVYFDRGIEIAEQLGDTLMLAKLRANRAEPLIHTVQIPEARKTLDEAERLASSIRELGTLADVARFRAMIARDEGDFSSAEQYIAESLWLAADAGLDLERAEALEELAYLLDAEGRTVEAFAALREAHAGYKALGAKRDAARTLEVLESWSSRMSTPASTLPEVTP